MRARDLLDVALKAVPGAQAREGQHVMAEAVEASLKKGEHLLVQAGTGTGKSLGYLVPAIASGRRVVVATATKALQAQLVDKDLPRLADALTEVLGRRPRYALAKGRSNYVCLQQLGGGPGAREPDEQESLWDGPTSMLGQQVVQLREWAESAVTGDRDEVPFPVNDRAWRQVSVTARECLGSKCPDRVDCFAEKAREQAKEADVVVANHALLAVATFSGVPVLPDHEAVILDEAHEFVDSATDALTVEVSGAAARRGAGQAKTYLQASTQERLDDAAKVLEGVLLGTPAGWIKELPDFVIDALGVVEAVFGTAANEVGSEKEDDEVSQARRDQVRSALTEFAESAGAIREPSVQSAVYATTDKVLRASPLWVGGAVADRLFGESVVIATSATLTLGGSFAHTAKELGLKQADGAEYGAPDRAAWRWLDVGSPFDYGKQGQLYVARDLPDPGRQSAAWQDAVDDLCAQRVRAAGGRTLALFASTAAAGRAAAAVR
ncbi:MAG: putative ATP-dependent helicase, DinG family, partial [Frankiales bacterium]|nr:putative ATP-dependent helicase, DinG family [Frankiales bacterium]